ncbi:MAG TPA: type II toxin-antitoxin system prevent-host-death family antitoxin [Bryobacteraceae bacterium]|jgi:antitoxin (DNA-binding transcriptional repressor) of toxin-antitoxin stability system
MASFNVHEAKTNLSRLLAMVERGEEVTILRNGEPVADLVRHRSKGARRRLGTLAGAVSLPEGWDRAMTDEEVDRFFEGREH